MTSGGPFTILLNDGKTDGALIAPALLKKRIDDIKAYRKASGLADISPTLEDIEKTHILFTHAHYRPFVSIAHEYHKASKTAGGATFGELTQFTLNQPGDFFGDCVAHMLIPATTMSAITTPTVRGTVWPVDTAGDIYTLVDSFGTAAGATYKHLIRYCEFPGNRIYQNNEFAVNSNTIDTYSDKINMMDEKFRVPPNKRVGYNRLVGQEVPMEGYSGVSKRTVVDATNDVAALGSTYLGATFTGLSGSNYYDISRKALSVLNGPQTPKETQPALNLWTRLNFWFCKDFHLALPALAIPFGVKTISLQIAAATKIFSPVNNLYVKHVSDTTTARTISYTPYTTVQAGRSRMEVSTIATPKIDKLDIYVNNIFIHTDMQKIFIDRITFTLIRVWKEQSINVADPINTYCLNLLKWPVEYMYVGLQPNWNVSEFNDNGEYRDWHRFTRTWEVECGDPTVVEVTSLLAAAAAAPASTSTRSQINPDKYVFETPAVNALGLHAHGVSLFGTVDKNGMHDSIVYNAYFPTVYGGADITTPNDSGALFINFALYPGTYQPSGYLNVSRAREFYIDWSSTYFSATNPGMLYVVASAINFLLITDGSALLRFST